jgi:hypothetical protein
MTQEEILEGNKLIAEFMGLPVHEEYFRGIDACKYHSDWNLLMPIVEKIESLGYSFEIELFSCYVIDSKTLSTIIECHYNSKIKSTYQAVVEFIKWYNQQNTKQ